MKALKWIAAIVLFVLVLGMLLLTLSGLFGSKHIETSEQPDAEFVPESVPESIKNLPVQNIKETSDGIFGGHLQEATLIDGFPCAAGEIRFYGSGLLKACTLAKDAVIHGNLIPKGTEVMLNREGNLYSCFFEKDMEIQGYPVHSRFGRTPRNQFEIPTVFYPDGRLRGFIASSDVMIQGIPCKKRVLGFFSGTFIELYENGNLKSCTLSKDAEIGGRSISAGSEVALSEDGEATIRNDAYSWMLTG